jgi:hypothetical protein
MLSLKSILLETAAVVLSPFTSSFSTVTVVHFSTESLDYRTTQKPLVNIP